MNGAGQSGLARNLARITKAYHVPEEGGGQRILMTLSSVLSYCLRAKNRMSLAGWED